MRILAWIQLLFAAFCLFAVGGESFAADEVMALISFKEAIYEDPFLVLASWNGLDPDPCGWRGVYCSFARDHVIKLNVSGSSLKGFLAAELCLLTSLQELSLHGNNLIGTIPKEFGLLKSLKVLDLGQNQLLGPIPPELGNLTNAQKIDLQSNALTGTIPPELAKLKYLQELRLSRNNLQGNVLGSNIADSTSNILGMNASTGNVSLCNLTQLKVADLSYNFLVGSIPKCLGFVPRSSFEGNCLLEKDIKKRPSSECGSPSPPPVKSRPLASSKQKSQDESSSDHQWVNSKPAWILALEIVTGIMVGALFFVAVFTAYQRCNSKPAIIIPWKKSANDKDRSAVYINSDMLKDVLRYNRRELEEACEDFSNIIGSSPDSVVYKGIMKGVSEIAVISFCIKEDHWTSHHELYYQREVAELARLNHENTAKLQGYCRESSPFTRMLVVEYASNGTLSEHLHSGDGCQLSWPRRMKIIIGIARGLKYLHSDLDPPFTITELNSNSVYLTEDFSPKLVDFESWKTISARSEKSSSSIGSNGPVCLLPNSIEERHLDAKGNVYAFGVLLLEIISGRPPYTKDHGSLVDQARDYLDRPDELSDFVDPQLKHFERDDFKVVCEVANSCMDLDPTKRPPMKELCSVLESRINLSLSTELRSSSLAWAELALDS